MAAVKKPVPVLPGQIWADADRRGYGRRVRIVNVDTTRATIEPVHGGRQTYVLYDERGLRGYRLVADAEGGGGNAS